MPQKSDLEILIELAQKRVRTPEGARQYGQPIGSVISDTDGEDREKRPITIERLKSLQRQFLAAKKTNNTALMKDIQAEFSEGVREFRKNKQDPSLLQELIGSSGRNEKSVKRGK